MSERYYDQASYDIHDDPMPNLSALERLVLLVIASIVSLILAVAVINLFLLHNGHLSTGGPIGLLMNCVIEVIGR